MSVHGVDNDWAHLYPDFAEKLRQVLDSTPYGPWKIVEGYRSVERQLWLYGQGRTRPGQIVTWMRTPKNHGFGLAADVIPAAGYNAPQASWLALRAKYHTVGLENPAWTKGDFGHVQWPANDTKMHAKAAAWLRAGFKEAAPAPSEIPVKVGGVLIPDADAHSGADGRIYVALRPVADALGYVIESVVNGHAHLLDDNAEATVPVILKNGRGFVWSRSLEPLTAVTWGPTEGLALKDRQQ